MTTRSRGFNSQTEWDPMRDDFDNSNYEQQYPDEDNSEFVKLDHRRLYITNIPKTLNQDGFEAAFSKYGALTESFLSRDPNKRYGLISYETPGEAKLAMMKLNKTAPLRLNIGIAHDKREKGGQNRFGGRGGNDKDGSVDTRERSNKDREDTASVASRSRNNRKPEDLANGDTNTVVADDLSVNLDEDLGLTPMDADLADELECLQLQQLKLRQAEVACKQRMLIKQAERRGQMVPTHSSRSLMPDGRKVVVKNISNTEHRDADSSFAAGAGDSNERDGCSCIQPRIWDQQVTSGDDSSTPSTCKLTQERKKYYNDKHLDNVKNAEVKTIGSKTTDAISRKSFTSKTTDLTSKKSDFTKYTDTVSKVSERKFELVHKRVAKNKSDVTCDFKYSDFYNDNEEEVDETNRLIQLRHTDYLDVVDDKLKIVIALAGYPKSKMKLRQMETFQRCMKDIIDMQLRAGLLKKTPSFLDYYLNRGAVVCICKDLDARDWVVRISPGLQERMSTNLILLKAKVKRLCLALMKIPGTCWPATAQDVFKLLQYFNPDLKTNAWKIYAQKSVDNVEVTSFLIDRVSGELIRGPSFKNVIDYNQMEFELTGYTEIYYDCLLSDLEEDLSSVSSRVKLLEDIKSENTTPRGIPEASTSNPSPRIGNVSSVTIEKYTDKQTKELEVENSPQKEMLSKPKDVKCVSNKDECINWSDETNYSDQEIEKPDELQKDNDDANEEDIHVACTSAVAVSEKTESFIESNENLTLSRNSNLNIDSNRGIAYHRRTNYLHVENELKIAITLEGYPQNKLEGTHIRRLKHLFKEYLHKDMKNQRFANLIIPKFQDIYLSNGAVIYICDSLETKDYLIEILPKFINSTSLKLTFRDIKDLVRYTRVVMRLPKEHAHVESVEIISKLKSKYPGLKPDCWKYYSDVAGKQKREFGVDPESLEVIKSPEFDPIYEDNKLIFRIIDRQKRDVSFEETTTIDANVDKSDMKKLREIVQNQMYVPIDPEITNSPLTRIRTNHYSDLIADDLKLYVGPSNYPESRVDDSLFHSIKRNLENIVMESLEQDGITDENIPKFHDMYLFDGVIFIICQNLSSRGWIEENLANVNAKLHVHLKSTEFRGAVGIISMVVKTDKDPDEVFAILQKRNPRLRTKFWRKISTVRSKAKLDVVLQIDKLSAQVMTSVEFNKYVDGNAIQFKLGHLQSLLKPKASLEELTKNYKRITPNQTEKGLHKTRSIVSMQGPKNKTFEALKIELRKEYPSLRIEEWNVISQHDKPNHKVSEIEIDEGSAKVIEKQDFKLTMGEEKVFFYTGINSHRSEVIPIIEPDSPRSVDTNVVIPNEDGQDLRKMILKIPDNILPDNKDDLSIIFDLLEDKNPGLNTELWKFHADAPYPNNGRFTILIDKRSATVIQSKSFDPTIGGEKLKFYFLKLPGLQRTRSTSCVSCGSPAEAYCARCGLTPYCSTTCQRRDWHDRHRTVCHNLARHSENAQADVAESIVDFPPPAPLRRPRSPDRSTPRLAKDEDETNPKIPANSRYPPGQFPKSTRGPHNAGASQNTSATHNTPNKNQSGANSSPRHFNNNNGYGKNNNRTSDKPEGRFNKDHNGGGGKYYQRNSNKQRRPWQKRQEPPETRNAQVDDECWEVTPSAKQGTPKAAAPEGKPAVAQEPKPQVKEQKTVVEKPKKSLVPKDSLVEMLSVGDTVLLSVESLAKDCCVAGSAGVVCVSLSDRFAESYAKLCDEFGNVCENQTGNYTPMLGDTFAYLNAEDGGWYRARCISGKSAALLDAAKLAPLPAKVVRLHDDFAAVPEFSCCLVAQGVKVGDALSSVLTEKTPSGFKVSLTNNETEANVGEGVVSRWIPEVKLPEPSMTAPSFTSKSGAGTAAGAGSPPGAGSPAGAKGGAGVNGKSNDMPTPSNQVIPSVDRPPLLHNSRVVVTFYGDTLGELTVRAAGNAAQRALDITLHDSASYGIKAIGLSDLPRVGQCVLARRSDGKHYRALLQRTSVRLNKYLLDFIDLGIIEVGKLEDLYECPDKLSQESQAAVTSRVVICSEKPPPKLTPPALAYLEALKDNDEIVLTLPNNARTASSGAEATLTLVKNNEVVNKKLAELCTPDWKKLQERGGDVLESPHIMYEELEYVALPPAPCTLVVLDFSTLGSGCVSAAPNSRHMHNVLGLLTDEMTKYCESELGREPYLPKVEELCIAQLPPYPQWSRAVLLELVTGAGSAQAELCFIDYGSLERVPATLIRKMMPEFVRGQPALASTLEIQDFPANPTPSMLERAVEYLNIDDQDRGTIHITEWTNTSPAVYTVKAPGLIEAMLAAK